MPFDADWILIQENAALPAYRKAQLVNVRGSGSGSGSSIDWSSRDGTIDFTINSGGKFVISTPRDVTITLENIQPGTEIELYRINDENSLTLEGISKVRGNDIDASALVQVIYDEYPVRLIYLNSSYGWLFLPSESVFVSTGLILPLTGLVQQFTPNSITANNGDRIAQWVDEKSGLNASQAVVDYQPIYTSSIFANGTIAGLKFDGSQEYDTDLTYLVGREYTIALVEARTSDNQSYIIGSANGGGNSALHVGYRYGNSFTLAQYGNDLDVPIASYTSGYTPTLWILSNNSRGKEIYKNGILLQSSANTDDLVGADLGKIGSALGSFYLGYLGLVATWTGDKSTADILEINDAINASFGVY